MALFEGDMEDTGPKNESTSNNEFSRTISLSKWFGGGAEGHSGNRHSKRSMDLSIEASSLECDALAKRFRLTSITSLSADLAVQPALGTDSSADGGEVIQAIGTVNAQVSQMCVRTNEEFDVNLEFSFSTVLKAMSSNYANGGSSAEPDDAEPLSAGEMAALEAASRLSNNNSNGGGRKGKKKGGKKRGIKGVRGAQQGIDDMGMKQLKDILMEYEVTDEIIEDESCFCTDGIVDCGEVVAQMFRSKLDPYPKKPGSVSSIILNSICQC